MNPPLRHALARPDLGGNERRYVLEALRSTQVSSLGPHVEAFERAFSERMGGRPCVAVSSGTAAVHLALAALGIGAGDEVVVPDLTYVATANAARYQGAQVVLTDVDLRSWTLDPGRVERAIGPRTRAIVAVHLYGRPAALDPLRRLARAHGLALVEDAAQALGATYRGRPVGTLGDVGCFSFYGNKTITTGEGGMVVARTRALARRIRHLRDQGMSPRRRYYHDELAFNYRITALQAALGLAQLERLDRFLATRERIAHWYRQELGSVPGLTEPRAPSRGEAVTWLWTFRREGATAEATRRFQKALRRRGVDSRPVFEPMSSLPMYRRAPAPVAARLAAEGVSLPTHTGLRRRDVAEISEAVRACLPGSPGPRGRSPVVG